MAETLGTCVFDALKAIIINPAMKASFLAFARGLISTIDAQITALKLTVLQLDVHAEILNTIAGQIQSIAASVNINLGAQFGFDKFSSCPTIRMISDYTVGFNTSPFMKNLANKLYQARRAVSIRDKYLKKIEFQEKLRDQLQGMVDYVDQEVL